MDIQQETWRTGACWLACQVHVQLVSSYSPWPFTQLMVSHTLCWDLLFSYQLYVSNCDHVTDMPTDQPYKNTVTPLRLIILGDSTLTITTFYGNVGDCYHGTIVLYKLSDFSPFPYPSDTFSLPGHYLTGQQPQILILPSVYHLRASLWWQTFTEDRKEVGRGRKREHLDCYQKI